MHVFHAKEHYHAKINEFATFSATNMKGRHDATDIL